MFGDNVLAVAKYEPDVGYAWRTIEKFWMRIADACGRGGSTCYVAYPTLEGMPESIRDSDVVPMLADFSDRSAAGMRRTLSTIRQHRIRALYFTDQPYRDPAYGLYRSAGVRRIVAHDRVPGDKDPVGGVRGALKATVNRLVPVTCDLWVAISELMRERAIRTTRVPSDRCVVVQNGLHPDSPGAGGREEARRRLGLGDGEVAVVSVGRAHVYKGVDFLLEAAAAALADDANSPLRFFFVGDGPHMDQFVQLRGELGLAEDRFRFLGRTDDVPTLLEGCDIAMHPAHGEGFSNAVLEYMRANLPVVVPDRPSVCQAIEHERTGLVYPRDEVEAAARMLGQLAADADRRRGMGVLAAAEMRRLYPWSRTMREFDVVTAYLAGTAPRPRPGHMPAVSESAED